MRPVQASMREKDGTAASIRTTPITNDTTQLFAFAYHIFLSLLVPQVLERMKISAGIHDGSIWGHISGISPVVVALHLVVKHLALL